MCSLKLLHVDPVRFTEDVSSSLVKSHPDGLNSNKQFNFILLDLEMVDTETLTEMIKLQPNATVRSSLLPARELMSASLPRS